MTLILTKSGARREFKKLLGQTNHFLITILVGLDAVESGTAQLGPTFATSWAPHDRVRSATRSREFALTSALAWTIDSLDTYQRLARRRPTIMASSTLRDRFDRAKSIGEKVSLLAEYSFDEECDVTSPLLVRTAIVWRNRLVHSTADNKLSSEMRGALNEHAAEIASHYRGLDVDRIMNALPDGKPGARPPSLKEVTSFISAAHSFVSITDERLLSTLNLREYFMQVLADYVSDEPQTRCANVWGKTSERCRLTMVQIARQYGMTGDTDGDDTGVVEQLISELQTLTPKVAREFLATAISDARNDRDRCDAPSPKRDQSQSD
jgi:hypothetical protein